ncbi:MAG: pectinesterase family protein [Acholeplasmataceae bacterium]|nr:pectinesterase family protein [Acholeplasmataceae bacterium]
MISLHLKPRDNIQEILDGYPLNEGITIYLEPGIYNQKLRLKHNHLKIIGSTSSESIITNNDYSYKMHEDGLLYNTFRTSTLMILGDYCELHHLTIKNHAGSGLTIGQAVALTLYGNHTRVINCKILGNQDTIFLGPLPKDLSVRYDHFLPLEERHTKHLHHFFTSCYIEGDVDYIFGSGTALFDQSTIVSIGKGYIAAPSTYEEFSYGIIFNQSKIINKSTDPIILARPWREFGSAIFHQCIFEGFISPFRFDSWDKANFRFYETPYVPTLLSKVLSIEEVEQLKNYCLANFNCSIK